MRSPRLSFCLMPFCIGIAPAAWADRHVDHLVSSSSLPAIRVHVAEDFNYLGRTTYPVGNSAEAEDFVFGSSKAGSLERAVVVHFEHFLPGSSRDFAYPRFKMVRLGADEYLNQTWALDDFGLFHYDAMVKLLNANGLIAERAWIVDRYVRALPENPKYEMIFFYLESKSSSDPAIKFGKGSDTSLPPSPPPAMETLIQARSRAAFSVEPG